MVTLVAKYQVKPGEEDRVESALRELIPIALTEEGCIQFSVYRSKDNPSEFLLIEQYDSEEAILRHRETPHFKRIVEGIVVPLLETRERTTYIPIDL